MADIQSENGWGFGDGLKFVIIAFFRPGRITSTIITSHLSAGIRKSNHEIETCWVKWSAPHFIKDYRLSELSMNRRILCIYGRSE